jgi:hypothetical protein
LILIDPEIVLETDAESRVNWAMGRERTEPEEPEAPESGGVGIDVALYEVRLENAHLLYRDGVSSREMVLNLDELTINRNLSGQLEWRIAALLNEIPVNIDGTTSYLTDLLNNQPFRSEMEGTVGNVAFTMTETVKAALDTTALKLKASVEAPNLESPDFWAPNCPISPRSGSRGRSPTPKAIIGSGSMGRPRISISPSLVRWRRRWTVRESIWITRSRRRTWGRSPPSRAQIFP